MCDHSPALACGSRVYKDPGEENQSWQLLSILLSFGCPSGCPEQLWGLQHGLAGGYGQHRLRLCRNPHPHCCKSIWMPLSDGL